MHASNVRAYMCTRSVHKSHVAVVFFSVSGSGKPPAPVSAGSKKSSVTSRLRPDSRHVAGVTVLHRPGFRSRVMPGTKISK